MQKSSLLVLLLVSAVFVNLSAQDAPTEKPAWDFGLSVGADFSQLLNINPRDGAGADRIGIGGGAKVFANYDKNRNTWKNSAEWLFGIQRFGKAKDNKPFEKAVDQLRIETDYSRKFADDSKWSYTVNGLFLSQVVNSYLGNVLTDTTSTKTGLLSHFLAPAVFTVAPGISYKPNKHLAFAASPATYKAIIVLDDNLAAQPSADGASGRLGNPWVSPTEFDNVAHQLGGSLLAAYSNKYFKDRVGVSHRLQLFSNYLKDPQHIDIDFANSFEFMIIKGLSINFTVNLLYDHDIPVKTENPDNARKAPWITEALLIKYSVLF